MLELLQRARDDSMHSEAKSEKLVRRRYVACVNEDRATKDRRDREAVVASLRDALSKGDKSLVGNKGYRKYLRAGGEQVAEAGRTAGDEPDAGGFWIGH